MSGRVILINPPARLLKGEVRYAHPPLGLAYIAANLEKHGYTVKILDCIARSYETEKVYSDGGVGYGAAPEVLIDEIRDFAPTIVGISGLFTLSHTIAYDLAGVIKAHLPDTSIVFGGTHATVNAETLIREDFADFVVRGEGEIAIVQLLEHLSGERKIEDVTGLTYMRNGEIENNPQEFIMDIDALPRPARHLLDMERYISIGRLQGMSAGVNRRATTLITSRGCPAQCVFCAIHAVWGRKFRGHSAEYVIEELKELRDQYGINHLLFEDDNLTMEKERAQEIFQGMLDNNICMTFDTPNGTALWRLDEKTLRLMKQAGCHLLSVAIESGDQDTMYEIIKKPLNLKKAENVIRIARKIGIRTSAFFVIGFPGETMDKIKKTLAYAERVPTNSIALMIATPYPGTKLYDICVENGYLIDGYDPRHLYTRKGQIKTPDFAPEELERLISHTHLRRAARFPWNTFKRILEKLMGDPKTFLIFFGDRLRALRP